MRWIRRAAFVVPVAVCIAAPPALVREALASAAGILYEAAPLVLLAALAQGALARRAAALFGCGCGHDAGPAALSLPAAFLCATTFGPAVALARFAAAVLLERSRSRRRAVEEVADPLAELAAVGASAFVVALGTAWFAAAPRILVAATSRTWAGAALGLALGLAAGLIAPCATAAVALAAAARGTAPWAAAGILVCAGLGPRLVRGHGPARYDARASLAAVAIACTALAACGGAGLLHPRFVPLLWAGGVAALVACVRGEKTSSRFALAAPGVMLAVLVFGVPPPPTSAALPSAAIYDALYPGEAVDFTGAVAYANGRLALVRYAITCCRADASPLLVPTDLPRTLASGSWQSIRGTVASSGASLFVRVRAHRAVPMPHDPFLYR